ncbi:hypothetical protein BgiBS90_013749, partial [Biomphalaria glabrata]
VDLMYQESLSFLDYRPLETLQSLSMYFSSLLIQKQSQLDNTPALWTSAKGSDFTAQKQASFIPATRQ